MRPYRGVIDTELQSWMNIQAGDVVRWPSGVLRVVRKVTHARSGNPRSIWCWFTIRHCSWTHRCYTLYNLGELKQIGVKRVGVRVRFKQKIDFRINRVIEHGSQELSCCDVRGIV